MRSSQRPEITTNARCDLEETRAASNKTSNKPNEPLRKPIERNRKSIKQTSARTTESLSADLFRK